MRAGRRSRTAQYVAVVRTILTRKGVLSDPDAARMLTPSMRLAARFFGWLPRHSDTAFYAALAARTLWFDRAVTTAVDDDITQVVTVGAGYDSRAWRMAGPGVTFVEVDHPATQADKRRRCPPGDVRFVALDLTQQTLTDALRGAGFDEDAPTLWVVEGVTMYLDRDDLHHILAELAMLSAPGSRLAVNFAAPAGTASRSNHVLRRALTATAWLQGEPFRSARNIADAEAFVAGTGWRVTSSTTFRQAAEQLLTDTALDTAGLNDTGSLLLAHR